MHLKYVFQVPFFSPYPKNSILFLQVFKNQGVTMELHEISTFEVTDGVCYRQCLAGFVDNKYKCGNHGDGMKYTCPKGVLTPHVEKEYSDTPYTCVRNYIIQNLNYK